MSTWSGVHYHPGQFHPEYDFDTPLPIPHQEPRRSHHHDPNPRRAQCHDLTPEYNPRYSCQDFVDQGERAFRSNQPYAPTFDGNLGPEEYVNWEKKMDQYFEFDEMSEVRKYQFAKSKLVRHANTYWREVEHKIYYSGDKINTWREMKIRLREEYLGSYYEQRVLD